MNGSSSPEDTRDTALPWAAYLLASWWDAAPAAAPAAADPAAVVTLLRRNGVPLLTLAGAAEPARALLAAPAFQAALAADNAAMARQAAAFGEIVSAWRAAGIPALFVKAMGPAPTFPYVSSNLDIAVPRAQQDEARRIVRSLGYVELRHIEEPNKFLFRRYHLGRSAFDLHIHGRFEWHTEFLDTPAVWARAGFAADCDLARVPAAEDGLLIALAHAIYENKALKLIELAKVVYACRRLAVDWDRVADGAKGKGWLPGLRFALALCGRWEERLYGTCSLPEAVRLRAESETPSWLRETVEAVSVESLRAPVRVSFVRSKRLFYAKMLADPTLTPRARAREVAIHTTYGTHLRLGIHSQRPMLVALDGIDGSGKSVHAELLALALTGAAVRHRVVWARGGSAGLFQPLFRLGRRLLGRGAPLALSEAAAGEGDAAREANRVREFRHPVVRALWPWLIAAELGVQYQWRIRWPLWRGEVVVADRYLLSAFTDLAARLERPEIAHTAAGRVLRWLAPRPRHAFWFDVPPEVALARKAGAESPVLLAAQAAALRPLAAELAATRVDATAPLAEINDPLVAVILRSYFDEHHTVLNVLFGANPKPLPAAWKGAADLER